MRCTVCTHFPLDANDQDGDPGSCSEVSMQTSNVNKGYRASSCFLEGWAQHANTSQNLPACVCVCVCVSELQEVCVMSICSWLGVMLWNCLHIIVSNSAFIWLDETRSYTVVFRNSAFVCCNRRDEITSICIEVIDHLCFVVLSNLIILEQSNTLFCHIILLLLSGLLSFF